MSTSVARWCISAVILCLCALSPGDGLRAQGNISLELTGYRFGELQAGGFRLNDDGEIHITATGAGYDPADRKGRHLERGERMFIYAWLLESETRNVVWRMTPANTRDLSEAYLREFDDTIALSAGTYELYFSSRKPPAEDENNADFFSAGRWLKQFLKDDKAVEQNYLKRAKIVVSGVDELLSATELQRHQQALRNRAVVSLAGVGDDQALDAAFHLERPGEFEIYALGEMPDGKGADYGWLSGDDDEKIFKLTAANSESGGGAAKNRLWRHRLKLPAGNYVLHYRSDGNHSADGWNANPPADPAFWGITLWGVDGRYDPASVGRDSAPEADAIVQLTRIGNNAFVQEGIEVLTPLRVRVRALGEGRHGEMHDYGWIVEARTGKTIWRMTYDITHPAQGADKNRMAEETLSLKPGIYWVYFKTDDSHAYGSWNSRKPRHPRDWGIALYAVDSPLKPESVQRIGQRTERPLVALTQVGDYARLTRSFEVQKATTVRVYALGEGGDDEMYDYGWITDARGKRVWEMLYENTHHGGGAGKNRLADQVLSLTPGSYSLHFQTDGSHSYEKWNARPPDFPDRWGISLYLISGEQTAIKTTESNIPVDSEPFLALTEIGNSAFVHRAFKVRKPLPVRIVALGEGNRGKMSDFGWIMDAGTGRKVWESDYRHSRHAGGAAKNRLIDETLQLAPGTYVVYFQTDDSHASGDWNARPPQEAARWGIALYGPPDGATSVQVLNESAGGANVLARITGVRNDEKIRRTFRLEAGGIVHIYAIGEGSNGEMYDYGWIENRRSREVVWIMNYPATHRAGGAYKNRAVATAMTLPAGEYIVHYVSDDSHAYNQWNSDPPDDRANYGITITRME